MSATLAGAETVLSRRSFLRRAGATTLVLATAMATQVHSAQAEGKTAEEAAGSEAKGILIDLTRCTGCNSCALACKAANERPHADQVPIQLDSDAYSYVATCSGGAACETLHVKRQCMHCVHPACASACTVGALRKTAEGPVVYDAEKCIGCRYCQYACPFGVPTYEWDNALGLIHKCEMCADRQVAGELPACVASCPNGALRFGRRTELLAQAHAQIETNPGRYVDHIYGESEAGGTSVLYLSPIPFAELGFPTLGSGPVPQAAENVMVQTPLIALTVASLASLIHLRMRQRDRAPVTVPPGAGGGSPAAAEDGVASKEETHD
jgi:formate dehydrogenase iron-sulfur subunit